MPLLHRIVRKAHPPVAFVLDGVPCEGRAGDTLLTAILAHAEALRWSEFSTRRARVFARWAPARIAG